MRSTAILPCAWPRPEAWVTSEPWLVYCSKALDDPDDFFEITGSDYPDSLPESQHR